MPHTSGNGVRKIVQAIQNTVSKLTGKGGGPAKDSGAGSAPDAGPGPDDGSGSPAGPDQPA